MGVSQNYFSYHFTTYVNKTIMLYTLNLYSDVCQLFLNKTGGKKELSFKLSRILSWHHTRPHQQETC